jgi:hypothetical protein
MWVRSTTDCFIIQYLVSASSAISRPRAALYVIAWLVGCYSRLLNIFAATLHSWRTRHAVGTGTTWTLQMTNCACASEDPLLAYHELFLMSRRWSVEPAGTKIVSVLSTHYHLWAAEWNYCNCQNSTAVVTNKSHCGNFPHERQSTDVRCYATACWFHLLGNQQYVTTQQYCNAITSVVFSWSVHTQQSVAMQRMTQLWSDQSGFQWVGPEPIRGTHRPNQKTLVQHSQQSAVSQWLSEQ